MFYILFSQVLIKALEVSLTNNVKAVYQTKTAERQGRVEYM